MWGGIECSGIEALSITAIPVDRLNSTYTSRPACNIHITSTITPCITHNVLGHRPLIPMIHRERAKPNGSSHHVPGPRPPGLVRRVPGPGSPGPRAQSAWSPGPVRWSRPGAAQSASGTIKQTTFISPSQCSIYIYIYTTLDR